MSEGEAIVLQDQRKSDRRGSDYMQTVLSLLNRIHDSHVELDKKLTKHMTEETDELAKAITKLMGDAFPEGDPDGHRRHHELVIKQAEEKAKFWSEMRVAAAKWAGLGLLAFAATSMWTNFLKGPH